MPERNNNSPVDKTVAIVRFSALGDVAMTIPVVYSAARQNPSVRFLFITKKPFDSLFFNRPANLSVVGIDLKKEFKGAFSMVRLAGILKRENVGILVDLHDVLRTKLLRTSCRLLGMKVEILEKGRSEKRELTRQQNKKLVQLKPTIVRYREVFERAGISVGDNFTNIFAGSGIDVDELYSPVASPKQPGEVWIGIAPFAGHQGKIYPLEKMRQVVEELAVLPSSPHLFFFGGGAEEERILNQWASAIPRSVCVAGKKLGFMREIALLNRMNVVVSMDSSNMHLASLAGCPVVSVWGATHPFAGFVGWHQNAENQIQVDMPCRPCSVFGNRPCQFADYRCLLAIAPETIVRAVCSII